MDICKEIVGYVQTFYLHLISLYDSSIDEKTFLSKTTAMHYRGPASDFVRVIWMTANICSSY